MQIKHSFPKLTNESLAKLEQILKEEFDYPSIPNDYKEFLLKYNGGYVSPGYIDDTDEFEHTHEIVFETPLKWVRADNKPVMPNLQSFFTVWLKEEMNEDEVEVWGLPDLVLSNEHSKYDFEVLPDNMMSIAKCVGTLILLIYCVCRLMMKIMGQCIIVMVCATTQHFFTAMFIKKCQIR